jgi:hypothetical protein
MVKFELKNKLLTDQINFVTKPITSSYLWLLVNKGYVKQAICYLSLN